MISFGTVLFVSTYTINLLESWVLRTNQIIDVISQSQIALGDERIQIRNYIIFNDQKPINKALADLTTAIIDIQEAKSLSMDNQEQQQKLDQLMGYLKTMQQMIKKVTVANETESMLNLLSDPYYRGLVLKADTLYSEIKQNERLMLEKGHTAVSRNTQNNNRILQYVSFSTEILLIYCLIALNINLNKRNNYENKLKTALDEIQYLAYYDQITGLPNRRLLLDSMQTKLDLIKSNNLTCAVIFMDVDDFKSINDMLGHDIGDLLLQEIALRLKECINETDIISRFGGDEFVLMLDNSDADRSKTLLYAITICKQILSRLSKVYFIDSHEIFSGISIGITVMTKEHKTIVEIMKQADLAMYESKKSGQNLISVFNAEI